MKFKINTNPITVYDYLAVVVMYGISIYAAFHTEGVVAWAKLGGFFVLLNVLLVSMLFKRRILSFNQ